MALQHHWWDAPTLGEFPALPPDAIPRGGARSLRNFLVHRDAKIVPRGNIGGPAAWEIGSLAHPDGHHLGSHYSRADAIVVGYRLSSASPTVDPWRVPINKPTSAGQLTQSAFGANAGMSLDTVTGTVTPIFAADVAGSKFDYLENAIYTNQLGAASTATVDGVVAQHTSVIKSNNGSSVLLTTGPRFVQDVISHFNRIFVAGARQPGGADYNPSQVFWTIDGGTTAFTDVVTDWQDPVSGRANSVTVGGEDSDFIVAFGRARGNLVIFKRRSVWILYGTSVEDMTLRQLRTSIGCIDPRSVVLADNGVFFASQQGFEFFDGSAFQVVSQPVADTWLEFSNRGPAAATTNYAYIAASALPNNYLLVALGVDPHVAFAADGAEVNWLYHIPSGAWTRLTSAISTMNLSPAACFARVIVTPNSLTLWGGQGKFARADRLTYGPDTAVGLRDRDASSSFSVPLAWSTGVADLGERWEAARLNRCTVDYVQKWADATPANGAAMGTVTFSDDAGAAVAPAGTLPGFRPLLAPLRARPTFDANPELPQGGVEATVASNIGAASSARTGELAIYGAGVEYETGRGRRKFVA